MRPAGRPFYAGREMGAEPDGAAAPPRGDKTARRAVNGGKPEDYPPVSLFYALFYAPCGGEARAAA